MLMKELRCAACGDISRLGGTWTAVPCGRCESAAREFVVEEWDDVEAQSDGGARVTVYRRNFESDVTGLAYHPATGSLQLRRGEAPRQPRPIEVEMEPPH